MQMQAQGVRIANLHDPLMHQQPTGAARAHMASCRNPPHSRLTCGAEMVGCGHLQGGCVGWARATDIWRYEQVHAMWCLIATYRATDPPTWSMKTADGLCARASPKMVATCDREGVRGGRIADGGAVVCGMRMGAGEEAHAACGSGPAQCSGTALIGDMMRSCSRTQGQGSSSV